MFFKKSRVKGREYFYINILKQYVKEKDGDSESIRYFFYDDEKISKHSAGIIVVGEFDLNHQEKSAGFYIEIVNNEIILSRLFYPSGLISHHKQMASHAKINGMLLYDVIIIAETNHHEKYPEFKQMNNEEELDGDIPATLTSEEKYELGVFYFDGENIEKDYSKAFKLFKSSANEKNKNSEHMVGYMLHFGYGTTENHVEALNWFTRAAKQGLINAQYNLGVIYSCSIKLKKDINQAIKWYELAANNGSKEAQRALGDLYYRGTGIDIDYGKAFHWYMLALNQGCLHSMYNIGNMYNEGKGVNINKELATKYIKESGGYWHFSMATAPIYYRILQDQ